jgi:hypothetical protein
MSKKNKKNQATLADVQRAIRRVERYACSSTWAEDVVFKGKTYPSEHVACDKCKHKYPAYYVKNGICYECYLEKYANRRFARDLLTGSTSIIRQRRLDS